MFLDNPPLEEHEIDYKGGIRFKIQRDDLIDPLVSGNKLRKLLGWWEYSQNAENKNKQWVTFGGAFSNHILATAAFCAKHNNSCTGVIRGDEKFDNHYLSECEKLGMKLEFVSRTDFRDKLVLYDLYKNRNYFVIPEGGSGELGFTGFDQLINSWKEEPEFIVHASATATTACGLKYALDKRGWKSKVIAVMVLKNKEEQERNASEWLGKNHGIEFLHNYEFGGYAKTTPEFVSFLKEITPKLSFPIDPVYVGKALFALIREKRFQTNNSIFLHTGGQLGSRSERFKQLLG